MKFRTGDVVFHRPSLQQWTVAWADYFANRIAGCDPMIGEGRITDCELVRRATDEEHIDLLAQLEVSGDPRAARAAEIAGRMKVAA